VIDGSSGETAAGGKPDRRIELAAAAYRRIARDGFEGLRTREVAADVGINIATLHYYFPTKEALIRGVIGQAMQRFAATMPVDGTPVDQLQAHLRALVRLLKDDHELWAVMCELVVRAPRDPDLGRIFRETDAFWHRKLRDLIARCVAEGTLQPHVDADDLASLIIVATKGLSMPTTAGSQPQLVDQVFRQFERLLGFPEV
jgi:AcrR family transcriptional regulator